MLKKRKEIMKEDREKKRSKKSMLYAGLHRAITSGFPFTVYSEHLRTKGAWCWILSNLIVIVYTFPYLGDHCNQIITKA